MVASSTFEFHYGGPDVAHGARDRGGLDVHHPTDQPRHVRAQPRGARGGAVQAVGAAAAEAGDAAVGRERRAALRGVRLVPEQRGAAEARAGRAGRGLRQAVRAAQELPAYRGRAPPGEARGAAQGGAGGRGAQAPGEELRLRVADGRGGRWL
ncbi:hypothetical protein ON010_g12609 [Phytophthora cinnamomi]|nr:hypothetical protein ON010_g12609 [Phytophthora cinnamomi]